MHRTADPLHCMKENRNLSNGKTEAIINFSGIDDGAATENHKLLIAQKRTDGRVRKYILN